jgi:hypothetical protein
MRTVGSRPSKRKSVTTAATHCQSISDSSSCSSNSISHPVPPRTVASAGVRRETRTVPWYLAPSPSAASILASYEADFAAIWAHEAAAEIADDAARSLSVAKVAARGLTSRSESTPVRGALRRRALSPQQGSHVVLMSVLVPLGQA